MEVVKDYKSTVRQSVIPFVQKSINNNKKCIIAAKEEHQQIIRSEMEKHEITFLPALLYEQIQFFDARQVYLDDDKIKPSKLLERINKFSQIARDEGYSGLDLIGDAYFLHKYQHQIEEIVAYETSVNTVLNDNIRAFCIYHQSMDEPFLQEVIASHYAAVVEGQTYLYNSESEYVNSPALETQVITNSTLSSSHPKSIENKNQKKRILIMDDNEEICNIYLKILEKQSFDVFTVSTGEELLRSYIELLNEGKEPDLIICDQIIDQGLNGDEITQVLRSYGVDIPIILSSGALGDDVCQNYSNYGFDDFISKPFGASDFLEVVKQHLHNDH